MNHTARRLTCVTGLLSLAVLLIPSIASAHPTSVHTVRPGESIQDALDRARPGDTVVVRPGRYQENLELTTDRVTLLGYGATLEAPQTPTPRRCSTASRLPTNPYGVCIAGDLEPGGPPTVLRQVLHVAVRGLTVGRFPSTGLLTIGARGTRLDRVDVAGGRQYGILLANSTGTAITASKVHGGQSAGIYVGDSPESDTTIVGTQVFDNGFFGVFIRDSARGHLIGNAIHDNCVGVGLLPTLPDQDTVSDWSVTANRIHDNNRFCPLADPPLTGIGLLVMGTARTHVTANSISGNGLPAGSPAYQGGGLVLITGAIFGGPEHTVDSRVHANVLHDNQPVDIAVLDQGIRNQLSGNRCRTSTPDGLCGARP